MNGPPDSRRPGAQASTGSSKQSADTPLPKPTALDSTVWRLASQQVNWWDVYLFCRHAIQRTLHVDTDIAADLITAGPVAGTPQWSALADDDPLKLAAVIAYSPHHALRIDAAQTALADAASEISATADWGAVGQRIRERNEWLAAHKWAQRTAS